MADREVMRIRVFQPDGTHVRDIQMQNPVCGIFIDRDQQLWIATGADGQVMHIDKDGKVLGFAGRRGTGLGEMTEAHMLALAPNGDIYVADSVGRKVVKFPEVASRPRCLVVFIRIDATGIRVAIHRSVCSSPTASISLAWPAGRLAPLGARRHL